MFPTLDYHSSSRLILWSKHALTIFLSLLSSSDYSNIQHLTHKSDVSLGLGMNYSWGRMRNFLRFVNFKDLDESCDVVFNSHYNLLEMVECWTNSKLERQEPTQLLIVSLLSILLSSILSAPIFDKHWMNNLRDLTRIVIMSTQRRWKLCSGMTLTVMELWVWERWLWCSDVWDTILLRLNFR